MQRGHAIAYIEGIVVYSLDTQDYIPAAVPSPRVPVLQRRLTTQRARRFLRGDIQAITGDGWASGETPAESTGCEIGEQQIPYEELEWLK